MVDFLNLPNKEEQVNQNSILQQIANTLGVTTDALNSAVNLANTAGNNANAKIIDIENRFNTLTTEQQQSGEVVDARKGKASLKAKIDEMDEERRSHMAEMATKDKLGHIKLQENWIAATLQSGWAGTSTRYAKNDLGIVTLEFTATAGTITALTPILILPVGYRPLIQLVLPILEIASGSYTSKALYLHTSGELRVPASVTLNSGAVYSGEILFYAG